MTALLLLLCTPGQYVTVSAAPVPVCTPYGCGAPLVPSCAPRRSCGPAWGWYRTVTPWEAAVNNMRAARAERPRPRPTESEWNDMRSLESLVEQAKRDMKDAPWEEKPAARRVYYDLREELDDHRLKLANDIHRRSRNGTSY
jgi:hypothetical protein